MIKIAKLNPAFNALLRTATSNACEAHRVVSFLPTCDIRDLAATDTFFRIHISSVVKHMLRVSNQYSELDDKEKDPQLLRWSTTMQPSHCYSEVHLDVGDLLNGNQVRVLRLSGDTLENVYKAIGEDKLAASLVLNSYSVPPVVLSWLQRKKSEVQSEWRRTHKGESFPDMSSDWTALHWAVYRNDFQKIRSLVHGIGVDTECKDSEGWTPLFWAVVHNKPICVDVLLRECGADVAVLSTSASSMHRLPPNCNLLDVAIINVRRYNSSSQSTLIAAISQTLRLFGVPPTSENVSTSLVVTRCWWRIKPSAV